MAGVSSVVYQCKDRLQAQLEKARESLQGVDAHIKRFNYRAKFDGNSNPRRDDRRNQERQGRGDQERQGRGDQERQGRGDQERQVRGDQERQGRGDQDIRRNPPGREFQSRSQRERYGEIHFRAPGHSRNRPAWQDGEEEEEDNIRRKPRIMSTVVVRPKIIPSRREALSAQRNSKTRDRDRRMFGTLLVGTLQKFQKEENQLKYQEDKRARVERKLEEAAIMERERVRRERQDLFKARKRKEAYIVAVEENLALIKDHEKWEDMMEPLMNHVKTVKQPHLHYIPKVHNAKSLAALERSKASLNTMLETKREELNKIINNSMEQWKAEGLEIPSFPRSHEQFEGDNMYGSVNANDQVSFRNGEESWAKNKRRRSSQDARNVLDAKRKSLDDSNHRKPRGSAKFKNVQGIQLSYHDGRALSFSDDSEPTVKIEKITPEKAIKDEYDVDEILTDFGLESEDDKSAVIDISKVDSLKLENQFSPLEPVKEESEVIIIKDETSAELNGDAKAKNDSEGGKQDEQHVDSAPLVDGSKHVEGVQHVATLRGVDGAQHVDTPRGVDGARHVDGAQNANGVQPVESAFLPAIINNGDIISEAQSTNEAQAVGDICTPKGGSPSRGGNVGVDRDAKPKSSKLYDPLEADGDDEVTSTIPDVEGDKGNSFLKCRGEKRKHSDITSSSDSSPAKVRAAKSSSESSSTEESSSGGPPKKRVLRKKRPPKRRRARDSSESSD